MTTRQQLVSWSEKPYRRGTKPSMEGSFPSFVDEEFGKIERAFSTISLQMSLTFDANGFKLVNDSASPGVNMVYGTNAGGTKGWYAAGGGGPSIAVAPDIIMMIGETGEDGERGPPGSPGLPGSTGGPGPTGPPVYLDAPEGEQGPMGPPGPNGLQGASGAPGAAGPMGYPGLDGNPGDDGDPGPAGAPGAAGATGPQGPAGPAIYLEADVEEPPMFYIPGPKGDTGATGPSGGGGGGGLTLTTVEVDLGSTSRYGGSFDITGLSGLTALKAVLITQAVGPYTNKGDMADEVEMDQVLATAYVFDTTTVRVYWQCPPKSGPVKGNIKFNYAISG